MNQDTHSSSSPKPTTLIQVNLDEFNISEDSFKPMTKGLGFHQDQKRASFKPSSKEVKPFGTARTQPKAAAMLSSLAGGQAAKASAQHLPTGLEVFYGAKGNPGNQNQIKNQNILETKLDFSEEKIETKTTYKTASVGAQFFAWVVDLLVVVSFVAVTGALLVFASGIQFQIFARLISTQDLIVFTAAIFSIYYLLYFTILDLSASPGKTIMGIRLLRADNKNVTVKNTFTRALISLLSSVALFLPMLLDFQGRLSDTKLVK
ncbi:MAG: RDD family protein [Bacteriovorax sp.]|nr:RDD family protein [Bacteriovorax sp.]